MGFIKKRTGWALKLLDVLSPLADLAARLWIAEIFFRSGVLKVQSWQSTLMLFKYEFQVPFLPTHVAAILGTGAELVLPVLLVLGLGSRLVTFMLFMHNLVAVVSYPFLLTPDGAQALALHINWGIILGLLMCHGSGGLSLDRLIMKYWPGKFVYTK